MTSELPDLPVVGALGWGATLNTWGLAVEAVVGAAEDAATAAASDAEAAAGLVGAPAGAAIDAYLGGKGNANGIASLNSSGVVPTAQVPTLNADKITAGVLNAARVPDLRARDGLLYGTDGRRYKLIAGTIRNTGSGWALISDATHRATGITGVTENSTGITINTDTGVRVVSLQVTADETYAALGVTAGASVGLDSTVIQLYRSSWGLGDYVSYDGTNWVSFAGVFSVTSYSNGVLTLAHASVGEALNPRGAVTRRDLTWNVGMGSLGPTSTVVQFTTTANPNAFPTGGAAATMRCWVERFGWVPKALINPSTLTSGSGNLWITGLLEVA